MSRKEGPFRHPVPEYRLTMIQQAARDWTRRIQHD